MPVLPRCSEKSHPLFVFEYCLSKLAEAPQSTQQVSKEGYNRQYSERRSLPSIRPSHNRGLELDTRFRSTFACPEASVSCERLASLAVGISAEKEYRFPN